MGQRRGLKIVNTIHSINSSTLTCYFNDIRKYYPLTINTEVALFERIKEGDVKARDKIINHNQRFVVSIAKLYNNGSGILMDLINEANIGLIEAVDKFDLTRGVKFISYAVYYIHRSIYQYICDYGEIVKQSNRHKTFKKLNKIQNMFFAEHGRYASPDEIIEKFEEKYNIKIISEKDVYNTNYYEVDKPLDDNSNNILDMSSQNALIKNDVDVLINNNYNEIFCKSLLSILTNRENKIINKIYGLNGNAPETPETIAKDLDLTKERIRQIKQEALLKLRKNSNKIPINL